MERGPAEQRALDADGEALHALERDDVAQVVLLLGRELRALHDALEGADEPLGLLQRLALEVAGEHGRRGLADRAALALEADLGDAAGVVEAEREHDLVAAERVEPLAPEVGVVEQPLVTGAPVVVQDDVLVEVVKLAWKLHRRST